MNNDLKVSETKMVIGEHVDVPVTNDLRDIIDVDGIGLEEVATDVEFTTENLDVEVTEVPNDVSFEFNYNMDMGLFNSLWNMKSPNGDNTIQKVLANKVLSTYVASVPLIETNDELVSKTILGKAKKLVNQYVVSYGKDILTIDDAVKLLLQYKYNPISVPEIVSTILRSTVYLESK